MMLFWFKTQNIINISFGISFEYFFNEINNYLYFLVDISIIFVSNIINMNIEDSSSTVFYAIEKAIKSYRKLAQKNISKIVNNITIDQKLVLQYLNDYPDLSQKEIAELVFKDNASMTRMINVMVKKGFLKRSINNNDRRRFKIEITSTGLKILEVLPKVIFENRQKALEGISDKELIQLEQILNKIIANCK